LPKRWGMSSWSASTCRKGRTWLFPSYLCFNHQSILVDPFGAFAQCTLLAAYYFSTKKSEQLAKQTGCHCTCHLHFAHYVWYPWQIRGPTLRGTFFRSQSRTSNSIFGAWLTVMQLNMSRLQCLSGCQLHWHSGQFFLAKSFRQGEGGGGLTSNMAGEAGVREGCGGVYLHVIPGQRAEGEIAGDGDIILIPRLLCFLHSPTDIDSTSSSCRLTLGGCQARAVEDTEDPRPS